ncbi:hypothetical protein ABZ618_01035 [Streptomyces roseolus]|uniref:hypothetical protein n=1 Tax=Streptomyces roseolus TaxID=67358 RepID=UPI003411868A
MSPRELVPREQGSARQVADHGNAEAFVGGTAREGIADPDRRPQLAAPGTALSLPLPYKT